MSEFDEFAYPSWLDRSSACRYFGLTDDDDGWDQLNELVEEFEIDCELGGTGDVLRINANDPGVREALFSRHERLTGSRPDHPERMVEARGQVVAEQKARRANREKDRKSRLGRRVAARRGAKKSRLEE